MSKYRTVPQPPYRIVTGPPYKPAPYRNCEFCGCHTNAFVRACCESGRRADTPNTKPTL